MSGCPLWGLMTCQPPRSCGGPAEAMLDSTALLNAG